MQFDSFFTVFFLEKKTHIKQTVKGNIDLTFFSSVINPYRYINHAILSPIIIIGTKLDNFSNRDLILCVVGPTVASSHANLRVISSNLAN